MLLLRDAAARRDVRRLRREIPDASILSVMKRIEAIGPASALAVTPTRSVDCSNTVLTPGLVNTHHHFYQTLTRAVPGAQDASSSTGSSVCIRFGGASRPKRCACRPRRRSRNCCSPGCTTAADHTYIWPNGSRVDDQIAAARDSRACASTRRAGRCRSAVRRRTAAGRGRRGRSGDPARFATRHRRVSRSAALRDDAHRARAVFAVFGVAGV